MWRTLRVLYCFVYIEGLKGTMGTHTESTVTPVGQYPRKKIVIEQTLTLFNLRTLRHYMYPYNSVLYVVYLIVTFQKFIIKCTGNHNLYKSFRPGRHLGKLYRIFLYVHWCVMIRKLPVVLMLNHRVELLMPMLQSSPAGGNFFIFQDAKLVLSRIIVMVLILNYIVLLLMPVVRSGSAGFYPFLISRAVLFRILEASHLYIVVWIIFFRHAG